VSADEKGVDLAPDAVLVLVEGAFQHPRDVGRDWIDADVGQQPPERQPLVEQQVVVLGLAGDLQMPVR
jgi:hypothetical protein